MLSANTPDDHLQQHHTRFAITFYSYFSEKKIVFMQLNLCMNLIRLQWQLLLEPSIPNLASSSSYARAFQLLLERKRLSTFGITSYELHKKSGRMIFPASSSLFQCLDTGYNVGSLLLSSCSLFTNILLPFFIL